MAELVGWVDPATLTEDKSPWPDAVMMDPEALADLLAVAHETCEAYAPKLAADAEVPARYVMAQILQARAIWQMQRQGPGDQFSAEGFSIAIYPLDARIRQMLRPKRPFGGLR
jgi:hypothetical protein